MPRRVAAWCGIALLCGALAACESKTELMSAVQEAEANEALATLRHGGIEAVKVPAKDGLVTLMIGPSDMGRAVDLLKERGLPRERFAGMGSIFKKEGLISSPLEERARYIYAISQELGATLSQIDGVLVARVHVVLPERGSLGDTGTPSSAAVFIKHRDGFNLDALQPQIRRLVTNSIPALSPEKVSIVFFAAQASLDKTEPKGFLGQGGLTAGVAGYLGLAALLLGLAAALYLGRQKLARPVARLLQGAKLK